VAEPRKTTACRCSTATAKYEAQWNNLHRPCALHCCGGRQPNFIIGELGPGHAGQPEGVPNLGPRLTIVDVQRKSASRGSAARMVLASRPAKFLATARHRAWIRRATSISGEVGVTNWKTSFSGYAYAGDRFACLQKLEKI